MAPSCSAASSSTGTPGQPAACHVSWSVPIGRIGPAKVLWGTDQPGLLGHANLPQLVRLAAVHFDFLSADERAMVMGLNALSVYG